MREWRGHGFCRGRTVVGAIGSLAGNMTLDRQRQERQRQQAVEARRPRSALQQEQTRIEIEEQRQFEQWRRQQGM